MVSSPMSIEMLMRLIHKGPYGSLSARLETGVVGGIQIRNAEFVHEWFDNGRGSGARHAGKGINIYNSVISFPSILYDTRNA